MKSEIGENIVSNYLAKLLRSIGCLIFISMNGVQVCHYAIPTKHLETTRRTRTEQREDLELVGSWLFY